MKTVTPHLLKFTITAVVCCVLFRYLLSFSITHGMLSGIILSAISYGALLFASGWYFGKRDQEQLPIHDVGFRFHLVTYLVHNILSELWFVFNLNSPTEQVYIAHAIALLWGLLLLVHFVFYLNGGKNSIAGLDKTDFFE